MMDVLIDYREFEAELEPLRLEQLAAFVMEHESCADNSEVSISFVTPEEIHELNREYRHIDRPTDVLSFPCDALDDEFDSESENVFELGDVIIAPEIARAQSGEFGTTFSDEIILLMVHGLLHLIGYDHIDDEDAQKMESRERELIGAWKDVQSRG